MNEACRMDLDHSKSQLDCKLLNCFLREANGSMHFNLILEGGVESLHNYNQKIALTFVINSFDLPLVLTYLHSFDVSNILSYRSCLWLDHDFLDKLIKFTHSDFFCFNDDIWVILCQVYSSEASSCNLLADDVLFHLFMFIFWEDIKRIATYFNSLFDIEALVFA